MDRLAGSKEVRTERRKENRTSYRSFKKAALQARSGKAKPTGFLKLAQDTPQRPYVQNSHRLADYRLYVLFSTIAAKEGCELIHRREKNPASVQKH